MLRYSQSMPNAIPSLELAKAELQERNGVFIETNRRLQPFHHRLLDSVLGYPNASAHCWEDHKARAANNNEDTHIINLPALNVSVYGRKRIESKVKNTDKDRSVVIIGGGILGTSIAMNAARIGFRRVTVLDQQKPQQSSTGETTPASWGWLNANQKSPPASYQWLNQLGLLTWHLDPALNHLPLWNGSLVQVPRPIDDAKTLLAGYPCEGPLSTERILELEQNCIFSKHPVYYFPQEGCVDPMEVVRTMPAVSRGNKVSFLFNHKVEAMVGNIGGHKAGLLCKTTETDVGGSSRQPLKTIEGDIVVSAAGVGSQTPMLGGIPLMDKPGTVVLGTTAQNEARRHPLEDATAENRGNSDKFLLSRILVDAVHESHILQRRDGTFAIGGGYPQVGGASAEKNAADARSVSAFNSTNLLDSAAKFIAPSVVAQINPTSLVTEQAVRPMPMDGYPSIGFVEQRGGGGDVSKDTMGEFYSVVTHSGITLAPLLGSLISAELYHDLDLALLRPWRPQRLFNPSRHSKL